MKVFFQVAFKYGNGQNWTLWILGRWKLVCSRFFIIFTFITTDHFNLLKKQTTNLNLFAFKCLGYVTWTILIGVFEWTNQNQSSETVCLLLTKFSPQILNVNE